MVSVHNLDVCQPWIDTVGNLHFSVVKRTTIGADYVGSQGKVARSQVWLRYVSTI